MKSKDFVNGKLILGDALEVMRDLSDIDIIVTSPPYYNAREYSQFNSYQDYLDFLKNIAALMFSVLKDNGRVAINVPDGYGRNPWIPVYADMVRILRNAGFKLKGSIVWDKGVSGRTSWGSWCSSSSPCLRDEHEMIIVAYKGGDRIEKPRALTPEEFLEYTQSVWHIKPENPTRVNHPAPYPLEIPLRILKLFGPETGIVLDPFAGSGTTLVAAETLGLNWMGIEKEEQHYRVASERLKWAETTLFR